MDQIGLEYSKLVEVDREWYLTGTTVTVEDGLPCEVRYRVVIDENWHTVSADLRGTLGVKPVSIQIANDSALGWVMNGGLCAGLDGCIDIDISFTPATNTLPIRRLGLAVGDSANVSVAWLRFPEMSLERMEQTYTRTGENTYRFESGTFMREVTVNEAGVVTEYPGLWRYVAAGTDG
jgi:hypothetical protein